jgi:PAS domain S-box-containing protein
MTTVLGWLIVFAQGLLLIYVLRQWRHPYRFPAWQRAWVAMGLVVALMALRRITALMLISVQPLPHWWTVADRLLLPGSITASLGYGLWRLQRILLMPLIIPEDVRAEITMDTGSIIRSWNAAATELFGWTATEAIGRDMAELIIPPRDREAHRQGVLRWCATADQGRALARTFAVNALHQRGHELPVEIVITQQTDALGNTLFHGAMRRLWHV